MKSVLKRVDGVIAKEQGSISGQRGETYCDVIITYVMIECNFSCNDVQENEICLNDSCKSSDGDENECKYSLWSPWSICNCKTQA